MKTKAAVLYEMQARRRRTQSLGRSSSMMSRSTAPVPAKCWWKSRRRGCVIRICPSSILRARA